MKRQGSDEDFPMMVSSHFGDSSKGDFSFWRNRDFVFFVRLVQRPFLVDRSTSELALPILFLFQFQKVARSGPHRRRARVLTEFKLQPGL